MFVEKMGAAWRRCCPRKEDTYEEDLEREHFLRQDEWCQTEKDYVDCMDKNVFNKDDELIILKANPLCQLIAQK